MPPPKRPSRDDEADVAVLGGGTRLATRDTVEDGSRLGTVVNALRADLALANGLRAAGLDPAQAAEVRAAEPPTVEALEPDADTGGNAGVVTVTNILLFILLQTYGAWVLTGVTREKSSRVVEVLLAVIRPIHLLSGKIAGIGAAALLHAVVLIVVAFVATRIVGADIAANLRADDLIVAIAWFLLGYALYCTALAAAGSLCARVEDAQGVSFPILLPLLFAYLVSFTAVDGASTLLWVLAFIPPTAVLAMPTLYAIGAAPLWAVFISMALTVVAIVLVAKLAAKIYERSVLHTGRKLSWREAFRNRDELPAAARTPAVQSERAADASEHSSATELRPPTDLHQAPVTAVDDPGQPRPGREWPMARQQLAEQVAVGVGARRHQHAEAAPPDDRGPVPVHRPQRHGPPGGQHQQARATGGDESGQRRIVDVLGIIDDDEHGTTGSPPGPRRPAGPAPPRRRRPARVGRAGRPPARARRGRPRATTRRAAATPSSDRCGPVRRRGGARRPGPSPERRRASRDRSRRRAPRRRRSTGRRGGRRRRPIERAPRSAPDGPLTALSPSPSASNDGTASCATHPVDATTIRPATAGGTAPGRTPHPPASLGSSRWNTQRSVQAASSGPGIAAGRSPVNTHVSADGGTLGDDRAATAPIGRRRQVRRAPSATPARRRPRGRGRAHRAADPRSGGGRAR